MRLPPSTNRQPRRALARGPGPHGASTQTRNVPLYLPESRTVGLYSTGHHAITRARAARPPYPCTQRAPGSCAPGRLVGPLAPVLDVSEQLRRVGPHQLALALGTGQLAVLHEVKGWHGAHLGARGDVRALVDIHLDEGGLGKVCCELLVDRLDLLARSTPAEASGEGGRSVGGARDGAAGVAVPRVVVASERAVRAAVLMVAVAMAEVEVATVVTWRRRCSWVCTGGAPARGEVDDAQALGGEC
jgi:hypothetical protein